MICESIVQFLLLSKLSQKRVLDSKVVKIYVTVETLIFSRVNRLGQEPEDMKIQSQSINLANKGFKILNQF